MYMSNDKTGGTTPHKRRETDKISPRMIKEEVNNGETLKQLVVRYHYENKIEYKGIRTTQWWHTKIIIIILGALVTGFVALFYFAIRIQLGG